MLLTLALALCVAPFAPGQPTHREFGKRTLAFPRSLLERQQPKKQQLQTTADSANNRHQPQNKQSPVLHRRSKEVSSRTAGIDCDNAPGIVIHDDGTVETGTKAGREYWGSSPTSLPRQAIQALIRRCAWRLTGCVEATRRSMWRWWSLMMTGRAGVRAPSWAQCRSLSQYPDLPRPDTRVEQLRHLIAEHRGQ